MPNIVDILRRENAERRSRVAILDGATRLTYGGLLDESARLAAALRVFGVRACDRVALVCEDGADYVTLALGILEAAGVLVPIPCNVSQAELEDAVERMDVRWLVTNDSIGALDVLRAGGLEGPNGERFLVFGREARDDLPDDYRACSPAFVRFSSGTTGTSKGVLISHQAIVERTDAADRRLRLTETDKVLWLLSMSFHFVVSILLFLRRGSQIVICSRDFPEELLDRLIRGGGTFMYASPVHYALMTDSPAFSPEMFAKMRMAVCTSMPLSVELESHFRAKFGLALTQAYGIIEVGLPCVAVSSHGERPGSVGRVGPDYELKLMGEDARTGEILLRGKGMFSAYLSPWRKREDLDREGWFHTGDMGRLDDDGFLYIEGRREEMINFAGMKIFAGEVEAVLNQHESVEKSLVFGRADRVYGQMPVAKVVLNGPAVDEQSLRRFCYDRLSAYKVPKRIQIVERLEKTASGKIRRSGA